MLQRIATFNVQGLQNDEKKQQLVEDFERYKLDILCIQETRISETETFQITSASGKVYNFHNSGNDNKSS